MSAANPNGPRARMMAEWHKLKAQMLELLEQEGPMTNLQMCARLGTTVTANRTRLCRMAAEGLLWSELIEGDGAPHMALYHFGPGESMNCKAEVKQRTVHKWKREPIKHEPLHAAFFGQRT